MSSWKTPAIWCKPTGRRMKKRGHQEVFTRPQEAEEKVGELWLRVSLWLTVTVAALVTVTGACDCACDCTVTATVTVTVPMTVLVVSM